MEKKELTTIGIKIGGPAGAGIKSTGMLIGKIFTRMGLNVFEYSEYPSLIRGGHNSEHITAGVDPVHSQIKDVHILLALNEETFMLHEKEVVAGGVVLMDKKTTRGQFPQSGRLSVLDVPFLDYARQAGGDIMANTVGIGAMLACLGLSLDETIRGIEEEFRSKKKEVADANIKALRSGYDFVMRTYPTIAPFSLRLPDPNPTSQFFLTGNDAVGIGAIAAGVGLYAGYPMTPTSSLLHFMVKHQDEFGYVVRQPEDEIAAANIVVGAMHMGVRAMCATSGGGFALMNETLALAGMIEEPFVVVLGQRPGPATGLPTWTEQGELLYAIRAGHGEFLKFVLAPGDATECFQLTAEAFNLAEQYQTPVILMTDKYLGESAMTTPEFLVDQISIDRGEILSADRVREFKGFERYKDTESGISPRTLPETNGGDFIANSDEHETHGLVDETSDMRILQVARRLKKLETARMTMPGPTHFGNPDAKMTVITWGSSKLPVMHAMENHPELSMNLLHFSYVWPMNHDVIAPVLSSLSQKKTMIVEGNATGQFESLLKEQFGFVPTTHLRRFDGRPIYPEEVLGKLDELV